MRRLLFCAANVLAGVAQLLLLFSPTRDLALVTAALAAAVILPWVLPRFFGPKK